MAEVGEARGGKFAKRVQGWDFLVRLFEAQRPGHLDLYMRLGRIVTPKIINIINYRFIADNVSIYLSLHRLAPTSFLVLNEDWIALNGIKPCPPLYIVLQSQPVRFWTHRDPIPDS